MNEGPMIVSMPNKARPQQRYDHRLRDFAHHTGDVTIATDLGVPRSTARGWLNRPPGVVVSLDLTHLSQQELLHKIVQLRRRVDKLAALLRLALALLRSSEFTLTGERLPDGRDKRRILRAVDRARACMPLRVVLRFLRVSPSRFHAWRHLQDACALDDQSSCPRTSPHRLTPAEVEVIQDMVTSPVTGMFRPARRPCSPSGSGRSGPPPRPGIVSCGGTAGDAPGSACIRRSRRWACERRTRTRCGTSTPPSSACSDGTGADLHAVIDNFSRRIRGLAGGGHVRAGHQRRCAA